MRSLSLTGMTTVVQCNWPEALVSAAVTTHLLALLAG